MTDDPTVKEVLTAVASIPQKVGRSLLAAKVPVRGVKRVAHFAIRHWLSAALSFLVLIWVTFHYIHQMDSAYYTCNGSRTDLNIPANPSTATVIFNAMTISPVFQAVVSLNSNLTDGPYDTNYEYRKVLNDYKLDSSYAPLLAGAHNFSHAMRLVAYSKSQAVARCISDRSWLTLLVVIGHAVLAYLVFLAIIPVRREALGKQPS